MRSLTLFLVLAGCTGGRISSEEEAALAYLGLDGAIVQSMDLGFSGFNDANSANIPPQTSEGEVSGTLTVAGQVDQGASANKGMRLTVTLDDYQDVVDLDSDEKSEISVTYQTSEGDLPTLELQLRGIPTGTFDGAFAGNVLMEGDLEGSVMLEVTLSGDLEETESGGTQRAPGTVTITGTATGPAGGTYPVDLTL